MSSDFDPTEFVDGDFQYRKLPSAPGAAVPLGHRAPTREEVDSRVAEAQQRLMELKRAQEELERERASLEETRRRQMEFHTGRQEAIQNLTRGIALLEEAEFSARRDAEQMAKALAELRDALSKTQAINDETWTKDNFATELTRGLTTLENARMEWNAARLKFPVLSGNTQASNGTEPSPASPALPQISAFSFGELCRLGFALTWPVAAATLVAAGVLVLILLRR